MSNSVFWQWSSAFDDRIAVIDTDGRRVSYKELSLMVDCLSNNLASRTLLFCLCDNTLGALVGYLACLRAGAVPLMLDNALDATLAQDLFAVWKPGYVWQPVNRTVSGEVILNHAGYVLVATGEPSPEMPDELGLLMTTSGSTGSPKLVRQTYRNLQANCDSIVDYLDISLHERPVAYLPMNYVFGLSIINSHLAVGATLLLTKASPLQSQFWQFIKTHQATSLSGVPYTFEMLNKLRFMRMALPHLTTLTQAGGKLAPVLQDAFAHWAKQENKRFFVMYGACEATSRMGFLPPDLCIDKNGAMGQAIPGGRFELLDAQGQVITQNDVVGELVYYGDNVSLGYAICREDLARGDDNRGRLVTGDMASRDAGGIYTIVGRKKRFLKVFGNRVGLDDIEHRIKASFAGIECAAGGEDDHIRVWITESYSPGEVKQFLTGIFQFHHSAFDVRQIETIPKNAAGKTLYAQLEAL